jgi:hypothetical protein
MLSLARRDPGHRLLEPVRLQPVDRTEIRPRNAVSSVMPSFAIDASEANAPSGTQSRSPRRRRRLAAPLRICDTVR